ncbi:hypothetical protein PGC35_20395 [Psychrobacillus sp. PGGUH221]|uniref:hypothetical protein n=1 Tax=Psychrobacillus sp. PGGUH221 TaxID=3020058 RepID=UPI0035C785E3
MIALENLNLPHTYSISTAKLSKVKLAQFGRGDLPVNASTLDLLVYITPFVDLDGMVRLPIEDLRYGLQMREDTFRFAISEAVRFGYLKWSGTTLYSHFHLFTNGFSSKGTYEYVPNLPILTDALVRNLSLKAKRLFYYFLTAKMPGTPHSVIMENLYRNKLHTSNTGVNYFGTFREAADAVIKLIDSGLINAEITGSNEQSILLTKETISVREDFYRFFNVPLDNTNQETFTRKLRTSKERMKRRVLKVTIPKSLVQKSHPVKASETELNLLLNKHHIPADEVKGLTKNIFISYKNNLYSRLGTLGLTIYRKALSAYLESQQEVFLFNDEKEKAANYFMDFYVLPEIQKIIVGLADVRNRLTRDSSYKELMSSKIELLCNGYKVQMQKEPMLIDYFVSYSSKQQQLLLDDHLNKMGIDYMLWTQYSSGWRTLMENNQTFIKESYIQADLDVNELSIKEFHKKLVEFAEQGILIQKEKYNLQLNLLWEQYGIKVPIHTVITNVSKTNPVPFYNWLEIKD